MADMSKINFNIDGEETEFNIKDKVARSNTALMNTTWGGVLNKNLLNISVTSRTDEDSALTLTVNDDKSITINGTAAADFFITIGSFMPTKLGTYALTGPPPSNGDKKYVIYVKDKTYNYGDPIETKFNITSLTKTTVLMAIYAGCVCDNLTFYPMVRDADIIDDTYEPYKSSIDTRLTNVENNKMGYEHAYAFNNGTNTNGLWFKLASFTAPSTYGEVRRASFFITGGYHSYENGILNVMVYANSGAQNCMADAGCSWGYLQTQPLNSDENTYSNGINTSNFKAIFNVDSTNETIINVELWCRIADPYGAYVARLLSFESSSQLLSPSNVTLYKTKTGVTKTTELRDPSNSGLSREVISTYSARTELNKLKSNIEITNDTIGARVCKNLFNYDAWKVLALKTDFINNGTVTEVENGFKLTASATDAYTGTGGYHILVKPNTSYILSWDSDNNNSGLIYVFFNGSQDSKSIGYNQYNAKQYGIKQHRFVTGSNTTHVSIRFGVSNAGASITYTNIMLRYGHIPDNTYEPYSEPIDSLQEQINTNKNELTSMLSKMLISSEAIVASKGWYRVFSSTAKGTSRNGLILIGHNYSTHYTENYLLTFNCGHQLNEFNMIKRFYEISPLKVITKIRLVTKQAGPQNNECYIDIYYNYNAENTVYVSILEDTENAVGRPFTPVKFTTAEIPEGYTSTEFDLTEKDIFTRLSDIETAIAQTTVSE